MKVLQSFIQPNDIRELSWEGKCSEKNDFNFGTFTAILLQNMSDSNVREFLCIKES